MRARNISWRVEAADNLTAFMSRLSGNLEASNFWNPQGLSKVLYGD
jgi:hypothetical protein